MNNAVPALARASARSLYEQLADQIREHLLAGGNVGGQIPTEETLSNMYAVSRVTVRRATQRLIDEGILVRRQGKGTFIERLAPRIVHAIDRLEPFMSAVKDADGSMRTSIIDFSWLQKADLPEALRDWETPVLSYSRVYFSNNITHAVTREYLPRHLGRRVTRASIEKIATFDLLQKKLHTTLAGADYVVSCRSAPRDVAEILGLPRSASLLVLERMSRNSAGEPVEAATHFLRPDVYQLSVEVSRFKHRKTGQ